MKEQQIFELLSQEALFKYKARWVGVLVVTQASFASVAQFFEPDKYQKGKYRTSSFFKHLHAAPMPDGYMNIHWDHGNVNRNLVVGSIFHGLIDCTSWPAICFFKLKKLKTNPTLEEFQKF